MRAKGNRRNMRGLQADPSTPENLRADRTAADFLAPCESLPPNAAGFSAAGMSDDGFVEVTLDFPFTFYGTTYTAGTPIYINNNGNLSFFSEYTAFDTINFPTDEFTMIAPFWADVDTRTRGNVYYKQENNKLIVIWDQVGYYFRKNDKANTFQVVLTSDPANLDGRGNVCFCYADMDWTGGEATGGKFGFGGQPATVGMNRGNGVDFVQFGRFDKPGTDYDGGYGDTDGVDFLDNRLGLPEGFCLNTSGINIPPVMLGFPVGPVTTVCEQTFTTMLEFLTPEPTQTVSVSPPTNLPPGLTLTPGGTPSERTYLVEWTPLPGDVGTYNLVFTATDSLGGVTSRTLTIVVPTCAAEQRCEPLTGAALDQCDAFNPSPFCEPFNSPEYCPATQSFPTLLKARNDIFRDDSDMIIDDGYWFPYLNDKAFADVFSSNEGYATPNVFCCEDSIDDLFDDCLPFAGPVVVRAADLHNGNGVFVFPTGIGGVEALRGTTMDMADLRVNLEALGASTTYLLEEFIPGPAGGTTLPTEYKFHVFNGMIGAVTVVHNRGTACTCVAEIDADGERLDSSGCFFPSVRDLGATDGACFLIDFAAGALNLGAGKNGETCSDPLPDVKDCLFDYMKSAAEELGEAIGVYARVDMFLGAGNRVYLQEYSINHHGARKHCWSRQDPTGCIDSCFMGKLWEEKSQLPTGNAVYGGPRTALPASVSNWGNLDADGKCNLVTSAPNPNAFTC